MTKIASHKVQSGLQPLPGVKNIIAIASGKGGVGKSTVTSNLALSLQKQGAKVGILDADIYGPSIPLLLDLQGQPDSPDGKKMVPLEKYGLQVMSIGFLISEQSPAIWRGPMVTKALMQMATNSCWDNLDYLLIDLPPGTGDIQLTLAQRIPVAGAVIVTTPQDLSLIDAKKALTMFNKVNVSVLGIVENMSTHICSECGHEDSIFGDKGGLQMSEQFSVPLLGQLPLEKQVREQADKGEPVVLSHPDSPISTNYLQIASELSNRLSLQKKDYSAKFGTVKVEESE